MAAKSWMSGLRRVAYPGQAHLVGREVAEVAVGDASVGEQLRWPGQLGGPLVPREQLDFQLGFQRPDLAGQHRLGDVQGLGAPAEVQLLRAN